MVRWGSHIFKFENETKWKANNVMIEHYLGFLLARLLLYATLPCQMGAAFSTHRDTKLGRPNWWCLIFLFMFDYFSCTCMRNLSEPTKGTNHHRSVLYGRCRLVFFFSVASASHLFLLLLLFYLRTRKDNGSRRGDRTSDVQKVVEIRFLVHFSNVFVYIYVLSFECTLYNQVFSVSFSNFDALL